MNLPNKLTIMRIIMIPVFLLLSAELPDTLNIFGLPVPLGAAFLPYNAFVRDYGHIASGVIFAAACATDALDGYIARKYKLVTDMGIFLDPIADKLLVTAALIILTSKGIIGVWIPAIIISREFIVTGLRLLASNKGITLAAGGLGKAKMIFQTAALILLIFRNFQIRLLETVDAGGVLMFAALVLTIASGVDYIYKNRSLFRPPG